MKGSVYAVQNKSLVKIGRSFRPEPRIKALQTQGGFTADNVFISNSYHQYDKVEIRCHEKLSAYRVVGEWFSISFDDAVKCIKDTIDEVCTLESEDMKEHQTDGVGDFCDAYFSQLKKMEFNKRAMILAEWTDDAMEFCISLGHEISSRIVDELFMCPCVVLISGNKVWLCYPHGFESHDKADYVARYDKDAIATDLGCSVDDVPDWDCYSVDIEQHRLAA